MPRFVHNLLRVGLSLGVILALLLHANGVYPLALVSQL